MIGITKNDILSKTDVFDCNEYIHYLPDWDDVADYFWSVEKRALIRHWGDKSINDYMARDYKIDTRLMWSRNYSEARDVKNKTIMYSYEIILNIRFMDGAVLRLSHEDHAFESEIEMIRKLLWSHSGSKYHEMVTDASSLF